MGLYIGVDGVARNVKSIYVGVGGVARKVAKGYIGVNGIARQLYSSGLPLSALPEGSLVAINESGSPVLFYLAKHDYESGLNGAGRTLIVRKDCYDKRQWHSSDVNAYASSTIDSWLNGDYKALLDSKVQSKIGSTKFYYTPGNGNTTVTTLERAIFLPSVTELGKSHTDGNTEGTELPIASSLWPTEQSTNGSDWTRSPVTNNKTKAISLGFLFAVTTVASKCTNTYKARPCFTLPADATVNPEPNADGSYTLTI